MYVGLPKSESERMADPVMHQTMWESPCSRQAQETMAVEY